MYTVYTSPISSPLPLFVSYSMGHKKVPVPFLLRNGIRSVCPKENARCVQRFISTVRSTVRLFMRTELFPFAREDKRYFYSRTTVDRLDGLSREPRAVCARFQTPPTSGKVVVLNQQSSGNHVRQLIRRIDSGVAVYCSALGCV